MVPAADGRERAREVTFVNNSNLELQFSGAIGQETVRVVNPDTSGAYWEVYAILNIILLMNGDIAIMTSKQQTDTVNAKWLLERLANFGTWDDIRVFVPDWEGQSYAFFNIDRVDHNEHGYLLILGDWIMGA
jgi:hypothetical protein